MSDRPRRRPLPSAPMVDLPLNAGPADEPASTCSVTPRSTNCSPKRALRLQTMM